MEIELYTRMQNPIDAIDRIGELFAKSGMFGCERTEQGKVLAMVCLAENKSPVEIVRVYDIIDGKLRKKALACLAEFRQRGGKHRWIKTGDDATPDAEAVGEFTWEGNTYTVRYGMVDAKRAGLVRPNSGWVKSPGNMLRARVISAAIGMLAPEILAGGESGDDDAPQAPAPALTLTPTPAPAPVPMPTPQVVEVPAAVVEDNLDMSPSALAAPLPPAAVAIPTPAAPTAEPKPFAKGPEYAPQGTKLPADVSSKLVEAIGPHIPLAVAWMVKEKWLEPGQTPEFLTPARAARIIKQRDSFLCSIGAAQRQAQAA